MVDTADKTVVVGTDTLCFLKGRILIFAARPMDWPVREFRRIPIYVQGRRYYLAAKHSWHQQFAAVYELWPWPDDLYESSTISVDYNEQYVAERDETAAQNRRQSWLHTFLWPLYPLLGLLWSGFKEDALADIGFEAVSISNASIALVFGMFLLEGVFLGWLHGGILVYLLGNLAWRCVDWILLVILGTDTVMRYDQALKGDVPYPWGFCEWLRLRSSGVRRTEGQD